MSGIWSKTGHIDINENAIPNTPRLLYLTTDQYNDFYLNVSKGQRLDFFKQKELVYVGYFKNGQVVKKELVKKAHETISRFWDDFKIRFRAAEIPFVFLITESTKPYFEELKIQSIANTVEHFNSKLPRALFMEAGESKKTPVWLDKGDLIQCSLYDPLGRHYHNKILTLFTGKTRFKKGSDWLYADQDGFVTVKAKKRCAITNIKITRNKKWKLKLKPGQTEKIKVYKGDVIRASSSSRYFVNGEIMEPNHILTLQKQLGDASDMEFKASVDPSPIRVWVQARRHH